MRSLFLAALALVAVPLFSGCDSATDGGLASTADFGVDTVTGTNPAKVGCTSFYSIDASISATRPGTWTTTNGSVLTTYQSGTVRSADIAFATAGTATVKFQSGTGYIRTMSVTVNAADGLCDG